MPRAPVESKAVYDKRQRELKNYIKRHNLTARDFSVMVGTSSGYVDQLLWGMTPIGYLAAARMNACLGENVFSQK